MCHDTMPRVTDANTNKPQTFLSRNSEFDIDDVETKAIPCEKIWCGYVFKGLWEQRRDFPAPPKRRLGDCCTEGTMFELGLVEGVRVHWQIRRGVGGTKGCPC